MSITYIVIFFTYIVREVKNLKIYINTFHLITVVYNFISTIFIKSQETRPVYLIKCRRKGNSYFTRLAPATLPRFCLIFLLLQTYNESSYINGKFSSLETIIFFMKMCSIITTECDYCFAGDRLRTTTGFVLRQPLRCLVVGNNGHRVSYRRSAAQRVAPDEGSISNTAGTAARVAVVRPAGRAQAHAFRRQMSGQRLRTATHHRHTHTRSFHRPRVQVYT